MKTIKKHNHLLEYIQYVENFKRDNGQIENHLALKFAYNEQLLDYLNIHRRRLDEKWTRYFFRQILEGLIHIRSNNHCHLDLKCENILLDINLNVKISDFGFAQLYHDKLTFFRGSGFYRSPQICRQQPFDGEKADVFALANVLYIMNFFKFPVESIWI